MNKKWAYYNEHDRFAAAWLRDLIDAGHIAPGEVDERSIEDVCPSDVAGFAQAHWFAGIGVWSYALRRAGWADDRPIWTGSCPCQPFSAAGKSGGFDDERHLWPAWFHLITQCGPDVVVGEQVSSKDGLAWLDLVQSDMEAAAYAFGALDICAAGVGAPHIRQRSFFVGLGDAASGRRGKFGDAAQPGRSGHADGASGASGGLGQPPGEPPTQIGQSDDAFDEQRAEIGRGQQLAAGVGTTSGIGGGDFGAGNSGERPSDDISDVERPGPTNGEWRNADWLFCRDGKWRPVMPGAFPLVNGIARRVDCTCTRCKTETVIYDGMRFLRRIDGGYAGLGAPEILRQGVLSPASSDGALDEQEQRSFSGAQGETAENLRAVRIVEEDASASPRRKPFERRGGQSRNAMSEMSRRRAFEEYDVDVLCLWQEFQGGVASQSEQDLFCPVCADVGKHLCEKEMGPQRVGQLRGYGNAIVAPVAATFIETIREIIG